MKRHINPCSEHNKAFVKTYDTRRCFDPEETIRIFGVSCFWSCLEFSPVVVLLSSLENSNRHKIYCVWKKDIAVDYTSTFYGKSCFQRRVSVHIITDNRRM